MKGVIVSKAYLLHEDDRRQLIGILNGELSIRNIKIIKVKEENQVLGNHWHPYTELMYVMHGSGKYVMKNMDTGEKMEIDLVEGDVILRTARIAHAGIFSKGSLILDAAVETYLSADFNDISEILL
jgi:hypothetical protein